MTPARPRSSARATYSSHYAILVSMCARTISRRALTALCLAVVTSACQKRSFADWRESAFSQDAFDRHMTVLALREVDPEDYAEAFTGLANMRRDRVLEVREAAEESFRVLGVRIARDYVDGLRHDVVDEGLADVVGRSRSGIQTIYELGLSSDGADRALAERALRSLKGQAASTALEALMAERAAQSGSS